MPMRLNPLVRLTHGLVLVLPLVAACSSTSTATKGRDAGDASHAGDAGGTPAPGTDVGPCASGCPAGSTCFYPIGSCSAAPQCVENLSPNTPQCGAIGLTMT